MTTQLPTRQQVENAADLDFAPRTDRQLPISITIAPDGIRVHIDYVDTIASIPAALERLRAAGLVDVVTATNISTQHLPCARSPLSALSPLTKLTDRRVARCMAAPCRKDVLGCIAAPRLALVMWPTQKAIAG